MQPPIGVERWQQGLDHLPADACVIGLYQVVDGMTNDFFGSAPGVNAVQLREKAVLCKEPSGFGVDLVPGSLGHKIFLETEVTDAAIYHVVQIQRLQSIVIIFNIIISIGPAQQIASSMERNLLHMDIRQLYAQRLCICGKLRFHIHARVLLCGHRRKSAAGGVDHIEKSPTPEPFVESLTLCGQQIHIFIRRPLPALSAAPGCECPYQLKKLHLCTSHVSLSLQNKYRKLSGIKRGHRLVCTLQSGKHSRDDVICIPFF